MTNDEAKAVLQVLREQKQREADYPSHGSTAYVEALDIALWLLERERLMSKVAYVTSGWLEGYEREHPRPGSDSRPPMSDDGPGNTL